MKSVGKKASGKSSMREMLFKVYKDRYLYVLLLPALILTFIFAYCPMPGLIMAFEDYSV